MKRTITAISALLISTLASAHNIWLEKSANQAHDYVIKFGHSETESYPEHKLKSVEAVKAEGKLVQIQPRFEQGEAHINADDAALVLMQFDNGIWSKLPNGRYVEKTKAQEPTAEFSTNPIKLGKAVLEWDAQALKAQGQIYELVPQSVPQAGKPLKILVLHKGKPVQGIKVGLGEDQPFNLTDAQGIAEFTPTQGYNKVWAEFAENVKTADFDRRSIEYMLTFDVP